MSILNAQLFQTALSPQDQLEGELAETSLGAAAGTASQPDRLAESPQELADDTFVDLIRASQAQIGQEEFFNEDPPDIIGTQEMVSTLVNSMSAGVTEAEATALQRSSPSSVLALLQL